MTATVVVAATGIAAVAAATADQDDDDDEPQAGTVVVSVVKAHDCHLTLRHSMRWISFGSLAILKFLRRRNKTANSNHFACGRARNGGFNGKL